MISLYHYIAKVRRTKSYTRAVLEVAELIFKGCRTKDGYCRYRQSQIAKYTGFSRRTVQMAIAFLKNNRLLQVIRGLGGRNRYLPICGVEQPDIEYQTTPKRKRTLLYENSGYHKDLNQVSQSKIAPSSTHQIAPHRIGSDSLRESSYSKIPRKSARREMVFLDYEGVEHDRDDQTPSPEQRQEPKLQPFSRQTLLPEPVSTQSSSPKRTPRPFSAAKEAEIAQLLQEPEGCTMMPGGSGRCGAICTNREKAEFLIEYWSRPKEPEPELTKVSATDRPSVSKRRSWIDDTGKGTREDAAKFEQFAADIDIDHGDDETYWEYADVLASIPGEEWSKFVDYFVRQRIKSRSVYRDIRRRFLGLAKQWRKRLDPEKLQMCRPLPSK